jgi:hypothetical protein
MDIKIQETPQTRPKINYDDILSSLHMNVINGKLQITRPTTLENTMLKDQIAPPPPLKLTPTNQNAKQLLHRQYNPSKLTNTAHMYGPRINGPIINSVEYQNSDAFKKHQLLQYIQQYNSRVKMSQIKSKKMLFVS